jgi:hypothetical protein
MDVTYNPPDTINKINKKPTIESDSMMGCQSKD